MVTRIVTAVAALVSAYVHLKLWLDGFRDIDMIGPAIMYSANTVLVFVVAILLMLTIDVRLTLIALIPLLLFGPASLFGLTAAITLGIFVGTYSSIYMAAPLLIWFGVKSDSFVPTDKGPNQAERIARGEV